MLNGRAKDPTHSLQDATMNIQLNSNFGSAAGAELRNAANLNAKSGHSGSSQFASNLANSVAKGASLTKGHSAGELHDSGRAGIPHSSSAAGTQPHSSLTFQQLFSSMANGITKSLTG
jgi:hypothetical protein